MLKDKKQLISIFVSLLCLYITFSPIRLMAQLNRRVVVFKDLEVEHYLRQMVNPLLRVANLDPKSVKVYFINKPYINAFVSDGQNIFIYSGLIAFVKSDAELQGVLAHEISHITEGHIMQGAIFAKKSTFIVLASLAAGLIAAALNPGQIVNIATVATLAPALSIYNSSLSFSRSDEMQADKHAINLLIKAGDNPVGLLKFLQKLYTLEGSPNHKNAWYSTHPLTSTRINFVHQYVLKYLYGSKCCSASTQLLRVQAKLSAYNSSYQAYLNQYTHKDDNSLYGLAISNYIHSNYKSAIKILIKLHDKHPKDPYFTESLADAYYSFNKFNEAYKFYKITNSNINNSYLIYYKLAKTAFNINTTLMLKKSLIDLNISLAKNRFSPAAWQLKSIILSKLGQKYQASLALAEEAFTLRNIPLAKKYAKEAIIGLKSKNQDWIKANDILNYKTRF